MKKQMLIVTALLLLASCAGNVRNRPVDFSQLPAQAQEFVKTHFPDNQVSTVVEDAEPGDHEYELYFVDGNKIEFDKKGAWKSVDCQYSFVPEAIIPKPVRDLVATRHPEQKILKIAKEGRDLEVRLNNNLELKFNRDYKLIGYDD